MQLTQESAEQRMIALGMDDVPLVALTPSTAALPPDWFTSYRRLARQFMESLTDSIEELAMLNLAQDEFMALVMGRALPQNMSLRFRTPLLWGGKMEIDNMFMCRTFPHSYNMDKFIIEQTGAAQVFVPNPVKKIYVPAHTAGGGAGGNATEDRLSQISAQISAGRDM